MEGRGIVAICQYGGEFVTNSDGSLSYSGGEAHALEVGHDMLFDDFKSELTSMFNVDVSGMSVKYFLPSNKRTLITISSDKDLQRMVDFTANALTTEVYIINKVDNRITRSTVADSGISNIGTAENARSGRRRRLNSTNRVTRARVSTVDSDTPNAITNVAGDNVYNFQEKRLFVTENDDNRMISDGFVMPITASSAAPDNARQRIITADNIDERYWLHKCFFYYGVELYEKSQL
ncbi:PB1 [Musa troglodytarum]|uniref:PB1 n=1 Tax=Musa troglodytarum TaxID=320322 RepID=A0A9E7KG67_9LILI|nr:PB1 [Musa troglodytarum]